MGPLSLLQAPEDDPEGTQSVGGPVGQTVQGCTGSFPLCPVVSHLLLWSRNSGQEPTGSSCRVLGAFKVLIYFLVRNRYWKEGNPSNHQ